MATLPPYQKLPASHRVLPPAAAGAPPLAARVTPDTQRFLLYSDDPEMIGDSLTGRLLQCHSSQLSATPALSHSWDAYLFHVNASPQALFFGLALTNSGEADVTCGPIQGAETATRTTSDYSPSEDLLAAMALEAPEAWPQHPHSGGIIAPGTTGRIWTVKVPRQLPPAAGNNRPRNGLLEAHWRFNLRSAAPLNYTLYSACSPAATGTSEVTRQLPGDGHTRRGAWPHYALDYHVTVDLAATGLQRLTLGYWDRNSGTAGPDVALFRVADRQWLNSGLFHVPARVHLELINTASAARSARVLLFAQSTEAQYGAVRLPGEARPRVIAHIRKQDAAAGQVTLGEGLRVAPGSRREFAFQWLLAGGSSGPFGLGIDSSAG